VGSRYLAAIPGPSHIFCVGDNILKHPQVYAQVKKAGHTIGNHTLITSMAGRRQRTISGNSNQFRQVAGEGVHLFRPPYGRITREQAKSISQNYQIVMWDVLSGDFDQALPPALCLQNQSSIQSRVNIVFHDSLKARKIWNMYCPNTLATSIP
jgi:peptidoglycan/xylan/chitin deacetylase (PgdA/CDA1 family)